MSKKWDEVNSSTKKAKKAAEEPQKKSSPRKVLPTIEELEIELGLAERQCREAKQRRADAEAALAEAKRKAEAEAQRKAEEEARRKAEAEAEAQRRAEEEEAEAEAEATGFSGPAKAWAFNDEHGKTQIVLNYLLAKRYAQYPTLVPVWVENGQITRVLPASEAASYNCW